jgi:uncharacterized RDD family membrane protein YckC
MACLRCGDICRCSSEEVSTGSRHWRSGVDAHADAETTASLEMQAMTDPNPPSAAEAAPPGTDDKESATDDSATWRLEVAARLNRYQSRRKPRPPRYPSLRLPFDADAARVRPEVSVFHVSTSNQALALDEFAVEVPRSELSATVRNDCALETAASSYAEKLPNPASASFSATAPATAKIIEFPRSWTPPPPALDELAEPVAVRPRILEAAEVVPPPPALGGITIEPAQQPEFEKRPGIDIPLQGAELDRRLLSALIDGVIVASACALFGFIFWKLTGIRPPRLEATGVLGGLGIVLWAAYQYLLVVYAGTTPGLRLAGLELLRFDERRAPRRLRRWRVLASYLSAVSLGMGYLWVFLDEDSLCWHDRITHTYLAPNQHQSSVGN